MSEFLVYHYCTVETFQNILKSKVLWLSDLTDSNDDQEVIRTFVNLWDGVKRRLDQTDIPKDVLEQIVKMVDAQYQLEMKIDPPYGICFCEKEDLLSQWQEYGDKAKGLSLGFDLNWIIHNDHICQQLPHPSVNQADAIGCENVIYHTAEFEEQMAAVCYEAIKQEGVSAWFTSIRPTFKHYSGFVKNPTFNVESEIRIVYYSSEKFGFEQKDVHVSDLKTTGKKHYEIPWINSGSQALKSICVGHNCALTDREILALLKENGIGTDVKITQSECSYRARN